jgi:hypothetical protein
MNAPDQNPIDNPDPSPSLWERTTTHRVLRWLFRWQTLRGLLLTGAGLITLVALFYAVENFRGKRAWDRSKRTLEAQGEKLDLLSLAPPPVPDDRNLAMAPLLKPLFMFTQTATGPVRWIDSNGYAHVQSIQREEPVRGRTNKLALGSFNKGTFADLEACRQFYIGNTNYPQPTASGSPAQDILVALGKFDADLRELQTAATTRSECRFPVDYGHDMPAAILLPHLAPLKSVALVLQLRAIAHLEQRQIPEAWADLQLGLTLADAFRREPILVSYLVHVSILTMHLQVLHEGLFRHAWTETQLTELEKRLASTDLLAAGKHAFRGERAIGLGSIDYIRRHAWGTDVVAWFGDQSDERRGMINAFLWLMPRGWFYQNMTTMASFYQDYSLPALDVQARRVLLEPSEPSEKRLKQSENSPYAFLAMMLCPTLSNARTRIAQMQTYVDAACLACALERYRLAQGRLPDTLEGLTPRFIETLPHDVVTGKPLHYRASPDGSYLIYSVGWNQTDDGGENSYSVKTTGLKDTGQDEDTGQDDWTWRMPR